MLRYKAVALKCLIWIWITRVSIDSGLLSQFNSQEKESTAHLSREGRSPGDWITQGSEEEWAWCILAGRKSGTCMYNRKAWKYANVSINFIWSYVYKLAAICIGYFLIRYYSIALQKRSQNFSCPYCEIATLFSTLILSDAVDIAFVIVGSVCHWYCM